MKNSHYLLILFFLLITRLAANDAYIIGQKATLKIVPVYQNWAISDSLKILEKTVPIHLYLPISRNSSLYLRGCRMSVEGDVTSLSGTTAMQMAFSHYFEAIHLVVNLGLNYPVGKKALTAGEFKTSSIISQNHLNFKVPNLGQGTNYSAGLSWALPLGERFVLGLGGSYQLRGQFKPIENMLADYVPGNEILLTGGFDVRLGETTTFTTDMSLVNYAADIIGSDTVFVSGNTLIINCRWRSHFKYNSVLLLGRFSSKEKNKLPLGGIIREELEKTTPDRFEFSAIYRMRFNRHFYTGFHTAGRFYQATSVSQQISIFGIGLAPEIILSPGFKIPVRLYYQYGKYKNNAKITGLELEMGMVIVF
ncbi:MAG: hypothetical protein ACT6FF_00365 [Methanosarcinaceae archaeon]